MSGYDKHPDYGGPEPSWRNGMMVAFVIMAVIATSVLIAFT